MPLTPCAPLPTLLLIPTGIGCQIGGFAGDGLPAARLLAAASGCLITHPNVMNGAALYWSDPRLHYVEGWALDRFASGALALAPVRQQRLGLLLDAAIEPELQLRHLQVAEACRATLGLAIGPVVTTDEAVGVSLCAGPSGVSWGQLAAPATLLRAAERLRSEGASAIAVVTRFPEDAGSEALQAYRQGGGVDGLAGAEALISHLLGRHLGLPCAHAPALLPLPLDPGLDGRAAAEELGHTFLACVLVGLSRAPDLVELFSADDAAGATTSIATTNANAAPLRAGLLHPSQIGAVVAPAGALGGQAVLSCAERGIPLIAVEGNPCLLAVTAEALGLKALKAASYAEAAGLLLALREGIAVEALSRPLPPLRPL